MSGAPRTVALNALYLAPGESSGTETYLRGLAPALAEAFPRTRFTLVTTRKGADRLRAEGWDAGMEIVRMPCDEGQRGPRTVCEQVLLPALAARRRFDVVHSLASVAPIRVPVAATITLHDATFFRMQTFNRVTTFGMRQVVGRAARHADALVAVSAAARDDICATLGLDPARFSVVPNGAGRPPQVEPAPEDALRARLELTARRVVLCVAAQRPHKNQELLVRALGRLPEDVAVVLVGHREPYSEQLVALAAREGVAERLRMPGYVDDADLEGLWRLASCAAFPTLAEGFGLPVLEALGRGVPVACSDIAVLREVGGDVPRYFDPHDPAAAAATIAATLDDRSRADAGRRRAAGFTWTAAAEGTFAAYERALAARRGGA
jgi:glycosyltransferase involved in cell wall biosynthesis